MITNLKLFKREESKNNQVYIFIDASNLWEAQKAKGRFFDYQKLISYIKEKFFATSIRVYYYTAYPAEGTRDYSLDGKHKFFTFLKKGLGFEVRKKELKRIPIVSEHGESIKEKGNLDVEITIDALYHAAKYNVAVFFTGDSDFLALITHLRMEGKKVYIFSSRNNVSEELRTGGNGYFDVLEITDDIWGRALQHRQAK
ncbi:MAG: NYN domain-containing protein [Patescibacteria group bacterium]